MKLSRETKNQTKMESKEAELMSEGDQEEEQLVDSEVDLMEYPKEEMTDFLEEEGLIEDQQDLIR